ncbi:hypothetical protein [Paenibacillus sp. GYB003]|uniref:hypothetical protein n=1 Tax=Paenibacillus sp. GYB003 TaxID=2994392 RepID=UPI002F967E25
MQDKPYFCPNCRSNRTKFRVLSTASQSFMKEAVSGAVTEMSEPVMVDEAEPTIGCQVCGFIGNEMRFVKQAEREPRVMTPTDPVYR